MDLLKWIQNVRLFLSYVNTHSKAHIVNKTLNNYIDKFSANVGILSSRC